MQRKAAVISLYHNSQNYGGVLQAYALNSVLHDMDIEAYQIDFNSLRVGSANGNSVVKAYLKEHSVLQLAFKIFNSLRKSLYVKLYKKILSKYFYARQIVFQDFRENYIKHTEECNLESIADMCKDFDMYICGSDQIWKPTVVNDAYMLSFVPEGRIKVSYAASMSVDSMSEIEKGSYKKWLESFDAISVREFQAKEMLQPLSEKEVTWVCDPTLLLRGDQWIEKSKKGRRISEKYIFCYFLGDDAVFRKAAKRYAKENNCKIVTFPNLQQKPMKVDEKFGDYQFYDATPFDFVSLIKGAECVFTDSFHATAFSLNMQVPFFVFNRSSVSNMNSRIYSILEITGCEDRFITNPAKFGDSLFSDVNWENVYAGIEKQRISSLEFLRKSLRSDERRKE